jgi:hypothetical protein
LAFKRFFNLAFLDASNAYQNVVGLAIAPLAPQKNVWSEYWNRHSIDPFRKMSVSKVIKTL